MMLFNLFQLMGFGSKNSYLGAGFLKSEVSDLGSKNRCSGDESGKSQVTSLGSQTGDGFGKFSSYGKADLGLDLAKRSENGFEIGRVFSGAWLRMGGDA